MQRDPGQRDPGQSFPGQRDPVQGDPAESDRAALAAQALARARADALARGGRPASPSAARSALTNSPPRSPSPGRRGGRQRLEDPAPLSDAIDGLVTETGWELAVATGSVFARWPQIVGPELAVHTRPEGLADGELAVSADSTAWATQLRLLAADLVRRLNEELGDGSVHRVNVRGPGAWTGQKGQWRVPGGRGPRDTYG